MKKYILVLLLSFLLVFASVSAATSSGLTTKQRIEQRKLEIKQKQAQRLLELQRKKENASKPSFGNGTFIIGKDIQPGTYRTQVASRGCYFVRLKGFGGSTDEIIANEFTNAPAIVTIDATDKGFKSSSCAKWTQNLSQITKSKTSFSDGIFIVGTDIEPGTYKNSTGTGCYYSRLSGFHGTSDEILANEFTNDSAIVTILSTDKGFKTSSCGTWSKINE